MFLKILVIMTFIDNLDIQLYKSRTALEKDVLPPNFFSKSWAYQKYDKFADSLCYLILLFYIIHNKLLPKGDSVLLTVLLIFRLMGTGLFLKFRNRKYLFYFPNFFIDVSLGLFIIQFFSLFKYKLAILILIFIYKLISEYIQHYNPQILYKEANRVT